MKYLLISEEFFDPMSKMAAIRNNFEISINNKSTSHAARFLWDAVQLAKKTEHFHDVQNEFAEIVKILNSLPNNVQEQIKTMVKNYTPDHKVFTRPYKKGKFEMR